MLLELAELLKGWISGFHLFQYLTFRAIMSTLTALAVSLLAGPAIIRKLAAVKAGQVIRSDGPQSHLVKAGTPTMGGVLIIASITVSTLLWADLRNRYVWLVLGVTLAFGAIGFYDDYKKLVLKDSRGLAARWKYFWQSVFGLGVALFLYFTADTPAATTFYLPLIKHAQVPPCLCRRYAGDIAMARGSRRCRIHRACVSDHRWLLQCGKPHGRT
jgi:phospho-N-acetylmuramoyl-pentapeptide-transferase